MNKYIFKNVKYIRNFLIVLGILSVIATITGIIIPYFNGVFVDVLIYTQDFNSIIKLTMLIITIGVVDVVFNYIYNLTYIKVLNKVVYRTKMQLIEHLRRVSYLRLSKLNPVYLNQRINIDVIAVFQFFIENYITCFMMVIVIILEGYMVFRVNVLIGGLVVLFVPVYVVIYLYLKRPLYEKNIYYKEEQNIFFHKINDQFVLLKSIKINADFAKNNEAMDNSFRVFLKKTIDFNKVSFLFSSCDSVVSLLFRSIMYIIAGCEIIKKNLTVGEFTMINAYFSLLLTQIRYFFNLGKKYQDAKSSYDRIEELLHIPKESNGNQVVDQINEITLDDISFRYDLNSTMLLEKVSYKFEKGKIYGISGVNGVGKSTLINILIGIINEDVSGEVKYGSNKLQDMDMYEVRREHIAVMSQEFESGFDVTVSDLLCANYPGFGQDGIDKSLKQIGDLNLLFDNEMSLADLWRKRIKDLSGGEKQKVSLVWCFLKDADVLILDEPTANMDRKSIEVVKRILKDMVKEKIIIVVSHDKSLFEVCDKQIDLSSN